MIGRFVVRLIIPLTVKVPHKVRKEKGKASLISNQIFKVQFIV